MKRKKLTPEMVEKQNARLGLAIMRHCDKLSEVNDLLLHDKTSRAVKVLGKAINIIGVAVQENAVEAGYKIPKSARRFTARKSR
jgi:hypothetical protein